MEQRRSFNIYEGIFIILMVGIFARLTMTFLAPLWSVLWAYLPGGATEINRLLLSSFVQSMWMIGLVLFFAKLVHHCSWAALGLQKSRQPHWVLWSVSQGLLLFGAMMLLAELIAALVPGGMAPQAVTAVITQARTPWEKVVPFIVTGLLAPVSEELLFRGFIYHSLLKRFSPWPSILLTALIFGCMHGDLLRAIPLMLGGIWLNLLVLKTDSLFPAMLAHSCWNSAMTILIYLT